MNRNRNLFSLLMILVLASMACLSSRGIDPNAAAGSVLFEDDFSGKSGGWDQVTGTEEGLTDYTNGAYRIFVNEINYYMWANPSNMNLADVRVEVDVTKVGGPDANDMGIICRYQDEENFYFFTIGSDGYYSIRKLIGGEETLVGTDEIGFNDEAIVTGNNSNHLRADCVGDKLTFYINGNLLVEAQDTDLDSGNVGLLAGTWETPGTDVHFDNFMVIKP